MEGSQATASSRPSWLPLLWLIACYATVDFLAPAVMALFGDGEIAGPRAIFWVFMSGCFAGQFGALAAWGALGEGRPSLRWTACLCAAECAFALICGGEVVWCGRSRFAKDPIDVLLALPSAFLCTQASLWLMNLNWGCRIIAVGSNPPPRRFTLQNLFFALATIAVALSWLRASSTTAAGTIVWMLGLSAWGTLAVVPCVLIVFRVRDAAAGVILTSAYVALAGLIAFGAATSAGCSDVSDIVLVSELAFGGGLLVLHGSFFALRYHGYALRRIRFEPTGISA